MNEMKTNIMGMTREEIIYDLFKNRVNSGRLTNRADSLSDAKGDFELLVLAGIIKSEKETETVANMTTDNTNKTEVFVIRVKVIKHDTNEVEYYYVTDNYGRDYYYQKGPAEGFDAALVSSKVRFNTIDECRREISRYDYKITDSDSMKVSVHDQKVIEVIKLYI